MSDARVAEIIEPKPELPGDGLLDELNTYLSGRTRRSAGKAWMLVFIYEHGDVPEWQPRTFISAPTWGTDGLVLEWVQGQDGAVYGEFAVRLSGEILRQLSDGEMGVARSGMFSLVWLKYYKPGDYAHALLAVLEDA